MMAPLFTNNSCRHFSNATSPCAWGSYPRSSVNATGADDYQKTLFFTRTHEISLVLRNTGHDYNGKPTGVGILAFWTHHSELKEAKIYYSIYYTEQSFKFGAGVLVGEAYEFAESHGLIVEASQPTVRLVSGYTQGSGYSPLAPQLGLGTDQVLEWEVVLASGDIVMASQSSPEYSDLYWALCEGGSGVFGAVLSLTVKANPMSSPSTASLTFSFLNTISDTSVDEYYKAIGSFIKHVPAINDAGAVAVWFVTAPSFIMSSAFAPEFDKLKMDAPLQPTLGQLDDLQLGYANQSEHYSNFLEGFQSSLTVNISTLNIGGPRIPRILLEDNNLELTTLIRNITSSGALISNVTFNVSRHATDTITASLYWRGRSSRLG